MKFKKILTFALAIILSISSILPVYAREEHKNWTYTIGVRAVKDNGEPSMISKAGLINPRATIIERDGVYTCSISFGDKMFGISAEIESLKVRKENEFIEIQKEEGSAEYPQQYTFEIEKDSNSIPIEVKVPSSPMGAQVFYLVTDWDNIEGKVEIEEKVNKAELEEKIRDAGKIEQGKKEDSAFNRLQEAIEIAKGIRDKAGVTQDEINNGTTNLQEAIDVFKNSEDKTERPQLDKESLRKKIEEVEKKIKDQRQEKLLKS
ncbi:MAG: hypothetical protein ACTHWZ_07675 [Peptoniphilaceae bacterium]